MIERPHPSVKPEEIHPEKRIWLVDISEEVRSVIHQLAEEATARYLNSLQRERRGFFGALMRYTVDAARRGLAELSRNYIYNRFYRQIEEEVRNNYNIFQRIAIEGTRANIDVQDRERMSEFLRLAIERFEQNIADRFSRDIELGESLRDEERNYLRNLIAQLIRDFIADPQIDTPEGRIRFNQELSRRVQEAIQDGHLRAESFIGPADTRKFDSPEFFASNIYDYILNIRQEIDSTSREHGLTDEQKRQVEDYISSVSSLDIKLAQLTSSIRTKIPTGKEGTPDYTLSAVERLCSRLENIPILNKIINPVTVGLAVSIGTREGLIRIGGRGLAAAAGATLLGSLGYLAAPIIVGAGLAGIFAYYRGRARFKQDAGRILREQAAGLEITDPRAQNILQRIALPGGENFRLNINDLIQRLNNNDEEAYVQALSRLNAEYLTSRQDSNIPQLDLLISQGQWRSSWIERIQLERAILDFENRNRERLQNLQERINNETQNLLNQVLEQDAIIKREARREGITRGIITGISAAVLGSAYQYLRDWFGETALGERLSQTFLGQFIAAPHAKERISFIEYILGERPRAYQPGAIDINLGEKNIHLEHILGRGQNFTLPDGHVATFRLSEDGHSYIIELSEEAKRAGWSYDPEAHKFIFTKPGITGTLVDNWNQLKGHLEGLGYKTKHVGWVDFAYEKHPPKVISWNVPPDHPGFMSEGLELSMSFRPAGNGDVIVKVPVKGIAFNAHGGRWDLSQFFHQGKLVLTLSPRDRVLQHDALVFEIKPEDVRGTFAEVRIPKEVAEIFFTQEGGRLKLNGAQLNFNVVVGEDNRGLRLVEVAADYNPRGLVNLPPQISEVPVGVSIAPPVPPMYLDPGIAIPPPLIDRTPGPGKYREIPELESQLPYYHYYTTSYFYVLEWLRKYGKDRTKIEDIPAEDEQAKKYRDALEKYRKRNEQIRGLRVIQGRLGKLRESLNELKPEDIRTELEQVRFRIQNLLEGYRFRKENPSDMIQGLIEKIDKKENITIDELNQVIRRINVIRRVIDKRLKKERETLRELEIEEENRLLNFHIEKLDEIEQEFEPDVWQELYDINGIPEDKRSYRGLIEYLSSKIPPMKKENRVSVLIPARLEGGNIYRTLEEYTKQQDLQNNPLDPNLYEIVIFVNRKKGEARDNTLSEIERFKKNNPQYNIHEYNIHVFELVLPEDLARVGFCRRVLTDVVLYRAVQREEKDGLLYLITEDADLEKVDPQIVAKTIERFEKYPHLDALRGIQLRNPETLSRCPFLWLERYVSDVTELLSTHQRGFPDNWYYYGGWPDPFSWGRIITGGWATSFKASTLAEIGGYDPKLKVGEDLFIGNAISILRSKENDDQGNPRPNLDTIKTMSVRHVSSPRRFLSILMGIGGYERFGESEIEKLIRTTPPEQLISEINRVFEADPKQNITKILNFNIFRLFSVTRNPEEGKSRSEILLQLFCLRKNQDYQWKSEGRIEEGRIVPGEIELTDNGVKKIIFLFEIFKYAIERLGVEEVIRRKIGLWPIIAGFKSLPKEGELKNKFEIIERIRMLMNLSEDINESVVISQFLSLPEEEKKNLVENLFRQKYGG
ncbi:MAG: hypothetical protein RQ930_04185 [Candidatus Aenigmarchaeota archaeon]|nr:hypothetical protein [Candidatus Aenigmarchaeota archaeon]